MPPSRSTSRTPVGLVTLISLRRPSITSMPTKKSPSARSTGASSAQISRSASLRAAASGAPPTARLLRNSPPVGTRFTAPSGSPSTSRMRLSPAFTPGRKACTITGRASIWVTSSSRARRPGVPAAANTTPWPARPPSGLSTTSPCSAVKACSSFTRLLTRVGAMRWLKRSEPSFSFQARRAAGRLITRTPRRSARSSSWVA